MDVRSVVLLLARRARGRLSRPSDVRVLEHVAEGIALSTLAALQHDCIERGADDWAVLERNTVVSRVAFSQHGDRMATAHGGNHEVVIYEGGSDRVLARCVQNQFELALN